ncbi:GerMN domain-containing protein [Saliterribacillus persicus]|uniref:Germination protein M n=1 Tax=Saliterribacillus persicus TaxID=930114 RepID=A0A368XK03_9BACI|nr:GerMN domain-containing protein [Saliterribacillus persicus]RCW66364.1 germination protein M [Saliterribacillus persicus]
MKYSVLKLVLLTQLCLFLLVGCGIFEGEQTSENIDAPPETATIGDETLESEEIEVGMDDKESNEETEAEAGLDEVSEQKTISRQIYLLDESGLVVPHTVELPNPSSKEVAKQVLEHLVKDGPITSLLPSGYQAVLPAGTEINSLNLEANGTLVVDVSEDFKNYQAEEELKILEAMTYTLTQFENVNNIKLWINGEEQQVMPVNGTPIQEGYSRANGINIQSNDGLDIMESKAVTLYFPTQKDTAVNYVPVTTHINTENNNPYQSIVQALLKGPNFSSSLLNMINTGTTLTEDPVIHDGVLTLTFNENILSDSEKSMIAEEVMQVLVLSLTENEEVEAVEVNVENHDRLVNEAGESYDVPVSRDYFVPTENI